MRTAVMCKFASGRDEASEEIAGHKHVALLKRAKTLSCAGDLDGKAAKKLLDTAK
jgi:hypothetical protein